MTPLQQLQLKIQKAKYPCGECGGWGLNGAAGCKSEGKNISKYCTKCKGTGTDIPLEFGCEILMSYYKKNTKYIFLGDSKGHVLNSGTYQTGGVFYCIRDTAIQPTQKDYDDIIQNLGKPTTLQDILLALNKKDTRIPMFLDNGKLGILKDDLAREWLFLDLTLTPQEYDEPTLLALIDLIS